MFYLCLALLINSIQFNIMVAMRGISNRLRKNAPRTNMANIILWWDGRCNKQQRPNGSPACEIRDDAAAKNRNQTLSSIYSLFSFSTTPFSFTPHSPFSALFGTFSEVPYPKVSFRGSQLLNWVSFMATLSLGELLPLTWKWVISEVANTLDLIPLDGPLRGGRSFLSSPWGIALSRSIVVLHKIKRTGSVRED